MKTKSFAFTIVWHAAPHLASLPWGGLSAWVPGALHDVDFMAKDSKRFADSGGWGYAEFEYDPASETFRPGNLSDQPPQANDAKCGVACHTIVKTRDYVFTEYGKR